MKLVASRRERVMLKEEDVLQTADRQFDALTGLYNSETFYKEAASLLVAHSTMPIGGLSPGSFSSLS